MSKRKALAETARVLWVEGRWSNHPSYIPVLRKKGYKVDIVSTGKQALQQIEEVEPDVVVVDAASMRTSGTRICQSLRAKMNGLPVVLIAEKEPFAKTREVDVNVLLLLPFTSRKLLNRIAPFIPGDSRQVIKAGPICFDTERKHVQCYGRKTVLTPRLIRLLELLLEHKGEVVNRELLFKTVWKTDYIGDTRTLDVHISWLRQAIEENPREPKLLKTIRGIGYRLDI